MNFLSKAYHDKRLMLLLLSIVTVLLGACDGDVSDDIAQEQSYDLSLEQCEVVTGGLVGEPIEPIVIAGVETQACLLKGQFKENITLKDTHQYKPLVWILDGVVEIGESKIYDSKTDLENDSTVAFSSKDAQIFANPQALLIIHRNGLFSGHIRSVHYQDETKPSWQGVVVNGLGAHQDCPESAEICNVEGPWGHFGGVQSADDIERFNWQGSVRGFTGSVIDAEGETNTALSAALVLQAPLEEVNDNTVSVFYSQASSALIINGGNAEFTANGRGNQGHFAQWQGGFSGALANSIIYHQSENGSVILGKGGNNPDQTVALHQVTIIGEDFPRVSAIELQQGARLNVSNSVVQDIGTCLQIQDAASQANIQDSVFYCENTTRAASSGENYAQAVIDNADNFYQIDPDLSLELTVSNTDITSEQRIGAFLRAQTEDEFNLSYRQEPCMGVGTALEETRTIGTTEYALCELTGTISKSFVFDDDVNDLPVAWTLKGNVTIGEGNQTLTQQQQDALLQKPQHVKIVDSAKIFAHPDASLVFSRGVHLSIEGSEEQAVEITSIDADNTGVGEWGGVVINGFAATNECTSQPCNAERQGVVYGGQWSADDLINIRYFRVLEAGGNSAQGAMPALTLNALGSGSVIEHVDVVGSNQEGLVINGGSVNIDHLLISQVAGDQLKWNHGFRGTLQYALLQSDNSTGHAVVGSNHDLNHDAEPRSRPVLANVTLVGSESADTALLLNQGSGLLLYNSVATDFERCMDIDDAATNALQFSDPLQVYLDHVTLDCPETLSPDDENSGSDYAVAAIADGDRVNMLPAVLDAQFVPAGLPALSHDIDFSLAGTAAQYLQHDNRFYGAVANAQDQWYLGWSDALGLLLAVECDVKAALETDVDMIFLPEVRYGADNNPLYNRDGSFLQVFYKVCGLRGTIKNREEALTLTRYTGEDADLFEQQGKRTITGFEPVGSEYVEVDVEIDPIPTIWFINGLVRVGEGHLMMTDIEQVKDMKDNPVTINIDPGAYVMASENGGLHITRGGALSINGEPHYEGLDNESGAVSLFGTIASASLQNPEPFEPYDGGSNVKPWLGLIVDGFGRNNQCPDAMAEPETRVCNIEGEYGYYGGYDNDYGNLFIDNLYMDAGQIQLNSVGGASHIVNYRHTGRSDRDEMLASQKGKPMISIDGGAVNIKNVFMDLVTREWGSMLSWHHGYQGTVQNFYARGQMYDASTGETVLYPVISGRSGEPGDENALPRSMPTLANIALTYFTRTDEADSYFFSLAQGSGMFLYNSVIGENSRRTQLNYCMSVDVSSELLVGTALVVDRLFYSCQEFTDNGGFQSALDLQESTHRQNYDSVFSRRSTIDDYSDLGVDTFTSWNSYYLPVTQIANDTQWPIDFSSSQTADLNFVDDNRFIGSFNYFPIVNSGGVIVD